MATPEERRKILEMVASGQISAGEAAELLSGVGGKAQVEASPAAEPAKAEVPAKRVEEQPKSGGAPRWLRIQVDDKKRGERKVQVSIPLSLVKFGLNVGSGFAPQLQNVDWDSLSDSLQEGERGVLVDVQDEEDGEHVQIYIE